MKESLLIVADRGTLKIYDLGEGGGIPRLLGETHVDGARWNDRVTDRAGSFPSNVGGATAERMSAEAEEEMRSFREIATRIIDVLNKHPHKPWIFAAPSEINGAIIDGIPASLRDRLMRNLPLDLTNVPAADLRAHLDRAQTP